MGIWLFLLKIAVVVVHVHAQGTQDGFLSIDCGFPGNSSYVDDVTNIIYVSDDQYVDTGSVSTIDSNYQEIRPTPSSQFLHIRSFPTGDRNCYALPVKKDQRYLVRARFMYGNYDGMNNAKSDQPLQFELHLGVNPWDNVTITDAAEIYDFEALTVAASDFTSICLINTGNGDPFISALELRHLQDSMYNISQSDLKSIVRYNFGQWSEKTLRYPDDKYDRFWYPQNIAAGTRNISTYERVVVNQVSDTLSFEPPVAVLQTALTPTQGTFLTFQIDANFADEQLYHILHFAELEVLTENSTRIFNIYKNNQIEYRNPVTPLYLRSDEVYRVVPFSGYTQYKFSLIATSDSTLPPIINAFELYSVIMPVIGEGSPTNLSDVHAINAIRKQYLVKRNWVGDPCSPSKYIWNGLQCNSSRITSLNLSSSGLTGNISSSFVLLTELTYLDLSNNNLEGAIPDALGIMSSLKVLILSCNNLTGPIPASLSRRSRDGQMTIEYDNTANACAKFSESEIAGSSSKSKISKPIIVVVSVVPAILLLSTVAFVVWRIRRVRGALGPNSSVPSTSPVPSHHDGDRLAQKSDNVDRKIQAEVLKEFTYKELAYVTRKFESAIGRGGFGVVYHGTLHDGKQVAVKMLSDTSTQGTKEFFAEAQNLSRIHHRNLVSLVGYCIDGSYLGLVYEYMAQGSLREHLIEPVRLRTLNWVERLRIAVESAQGLEYLHKGCSPPIIHRDVKTTNILLNNEMEAKLADFGLSKAFHNHRYQTHVSTQGVVGTPGYLDPEYQNSLVLKEKSDVYSFGVVLMELITGLPPIIPGDENVHIAERVVQSVERGSIDDIVDKTLHGEYDANSMWKIVDLSLNCTAPRGSRRPSMSEVLVQLKETLDLALVTADSGKSENYKSIVYMSPSAR